MKGKNKVINQTLFIRNNTLQGFYSGPLTLPCVTHGAACHALLLPPAFSCTSPYDMGRKVGEGPSKPPNKDNGTKHMMLKCYENIWKIMLLWL